MYDDVLQRNADGELEIRTVATTGDTSTNKDDVFTRDSQGRLCVRTTGGGGGGASTAAEVSFDPAGTNYIQSDNVQGALAELDTELKTTNDEIDKKVDTAQGADNSGKLLGVGSDGNVALLDNPVPAAGTAGQVLTKTADGSEWANAPAGGLPDQTGNAGKFLKTDGTEVSWGEALYNKANNANVSLAINGYATNNNSISLSPVSNFWATKASGDSSIAIGNEGGANICTAGGYASIAIGSGAQAIGDYSISIGEAINVGKSSIAIGGYTNKFSCVGSIYLKAYFQQVSNNPFDDNSFYIGLANKDYKLLDETGLIPVERLPQTNYGLKISDTFTQAVNTASTYNLFTTVDLATDVTLETGKTKDSYSVADGALKLPTNAGYVDYSIEVRLNGAFAGGENTNREFTIQLQRADGSIVSEKAVVKVAGNDLSKSSVVFETYTNTLEDPFIASGLKIVVNNTSGQTLNLTGCDILIKARA